MKRMHRLWSFLVALGVVVPGAAHGQGIYLGFEMGQNFVPGMNTTGDSDDRASVCRRVYQPAVHDRDTNCRV